MKSGFQLERFVINEYKDIYMQESSPKSLEAPESSTPARVGVIICDCGGQISGVVDTQELCSRASQIPEVAYTAHEAYPCSKDGRVRLQKAIAEQNLERVLVAGCSPRLVLNLFRETALTAGLPNRGLNMANIREHCAYLDADAPDLALEKATGLIEMAVIRLATTKPAQPRKGRILKSALIIGGDLSALTAAYTLAEAGYHITLADRSGSYGETAPGDLRKHTLQQTIEKGQVVMKHPLIDTLFNCELLEVTGHPGEYEVKLLQNDREIYISAGAIIASNSTQHKRLGEDQWFDRSRVKTQAEFETELENAQGGLSPLTLHNVVFILCAEPSQREQCSRICCNIGIRQALQAKQMNPDANVTVLFRELYLGGMSAGYENELILARKKGVTFFRYRGERPPIIGSQTVDILDTLTGEPVRVPFDRVVMSMPPVPVDNTLKLASLLGLPLDESGFLAEPRLRLRPGRYAERGIFVMGSSQLPADADETLFQAYLTSARVARFLTRDNILVETPSARIDPSLCTGCGNCPQVCPASAIHLEKTDGVLSRSEIDELRCFGCGNCVVVCPSKAVTLPGWDNIEIPVQIQVALQSRSFQSGDPKIIVLACEWSAYAAADVAGARYRGSRDPALKFPANVRIIRMNCSARFDPFHILWAFLNGANGVFLGACPPGECHYGSGNLYAQDRVELLKKSLAQHGVDPRCLHLEFMSVDDGAKFAHSLTHFVNEINELG